MIDGKLGYGVLGLGIGMAHAEAAQLSDNAVLCAACDIDENRLREFSEIYPDAVTYSDFEDMLRDRRVDIVSICLPSSMHADFAVRAMEAGKHVLIEKPVDITPKAAGKIERARISTGMVAGVVHQNRFNLNMYPIRDAINSGRLGRIYLGKFAVLWYRDQKYYDRGDWRGTWEYDGGGSLMNQAIHTLDIMRWLMGDVESVTSYMDIVDHKISTEDLTASLVKFKSGAVATFISTTCAYPGISTDICIYGTGGSIEANADTIKLWRMKDAEDEDVEEQEMTGKYSGGNAGASSFDSRLYGHRYVVEDMILAVKNGTEPAVTPSDAIKSLEVATAIYKSAQTGKTVYLNEK